MCLGGPYPFFVQRARPRGKKNAASLRIKKMSLTQTTVTKISGDTDKSVEGFSLQQNDSVNIGIICAPLTIGTLNTFVGHQVAELSYVGSSNALLGYAAGRNLAGDGNTYMGFYSAANATTGSGNVFVGSSSGERCISGGQNVVLGARADVETGATFAAVAVGSRARAGSSNAVAIGANAHANGHDAVAIGAGAAADGDGVFNIANRVRGAPVGASSYAVQIGADVLRLPGALALCDPVSLSAQWWFYLDGGGRTADGKRYADLVLRSANHATTRFTDEFWPSIFDFRGQHRCAVEDRDRDAIFPGCLVVSTGRYESAPSLDETAPCVPCVGLSRWANDPRVFGVASGFEPPGTFREYRLGNIGFLRPRTKGELPHLIVNAVGEGPVWVCDVNGVLSNGDLLTTSPIPGIAMRQRSPLVNNYTLGKATCDCDFRSNVPGPVLPTPCGTARRVLVGCTYRC